ncbi:MAG: type II toxin-antitoxin system HigB family toxin [Bacteroidota bacterium]
MRVIAKKTLREFWVKHADSQGQLEAWYNEAKKAVWTTPNDIKREYPSASFIAGNRVVFNIKGNHYRLIVKISYEYGMVWSRFVGTHKDYDKIDAATV